MYMPGTGEVTAVAHPTDVEFVLKGKFTSFVKVCALFAQCLVLGRLMILAWEQWHPPGRVFQSFVQRVAW